MKTNPKVTTKKSIFDTDPTGSIAGPLGTQSQYFEQKERNSGKKPFFQPWQSQKTGSIDPGVLFESEPGDLFDKLSNHSSEEVTSAQPQAPRNPTLRKDSPFTHKPPHQPFQPSRTYTPDSIPGDLSKHPKKLDSDLLSNYSFDIERPQSSTPDPAPDPQLVTTQHPKLKRFSLGDPQGPQTHPPIHLKTDTLLYSKSRPYTSNPGQLPKIAESRRFEESQNVITEKDDSNSDSQNEDSL